jgi:diguanylate cyclase (GGDEF)-like protein
MVADSLISTAGKPPGLARPGANKRGVYWLVAAAAALGFVLGALLLSHVQRARADRRLEAVLRLVDDELGLVLQRLGNAANRAAQARANGIEEHEVSLSFPEVEQDDLTGLRNRTGYEADLEREIQAARRTGRPLSLLLLEVRTSANTTPPAGPARDQLLRELASLLQGLTRSTDTVFRRSEDELGILLPETPAEGARQFHGRVREEVAHAPFSRRAPMTFSVGLAEWRPNETRESFDARASAAVGPFEPPTRLRPPGSR